MRKLALCIVAVLVLVVLRLALRGSGTAYDPSKVDAKLQSMGEQYQSVTLSCCMCGHLDFRVVTADGKTNRFAIVAQSRSEASPDGMWMWGATSGHDTNVPAVAMNADTRRMLIGLVQRHIPPGFDHDQSLIVLRGDVRDHIAAISHALAARLR